MATTTDTLIFELKVKDDASSTFDAWEKRLRKLADEAETAVKSVNSSFAGLGGSKVFDKIKSSFKNVFTGMFGWLADFAKSSFISIFSGLASLVKGALSGVKDVFVDAFKSSVDLEDALSGARRTANLTDDQFESLMKTTRKLSTEQLSGAISAEELGEIYEIAGQRAILSGDDFENSSETASKFVVDIAKTAKSLDLSFKKTADSLGKIQGLYRESGVSVGQLGNAFNVLSDSTQASAAPMIEMTRRLAPLASQFKIGLGAIVGFSGAMDELAIRPQQASTALKRLFMEMNTNTKGFADELGLNFEKLNSLVQTDIIAAFEMVLGAINKMSESGQGGVQKVAQAMENLKLKGDGVSTVMLGLAGMGSRLKEEFLDPAAEGLTNMDSITAEFINNISRASEIWGALGVIWENTIGQFTDAMLPALKEMLKWVNETATSFSKWVIAQGIIEVLRATTMAFWNDSLKPMLESFVEWVKTSETLSTMFSETIPAAITAAGSSLSELAGRFEELFGYVIEGTGFVDALLLTFPEFIPIKKIIMDIASAFQEVIKWINESQTKVEGSTVPWSKVFTDIAQIVQTTADVIEGLGIALEVVGIALKAVMLIFSPFGIGFLGIIDQINNGINFVIDLIDSGWTVAWENLKNAVKENIQDSLKWISDFGDKIAALWNKITGAKDAAAEAGEAAAEAETKAVKESTKELDTHKKAIQDNTKELEHYGDVSTGNSVWPDENMWLGKNKASVNALSSSISAGTQTLSAMGSVANSIGSQISSQMGKASQSLAAFATQNAAIMAQFSPESTAGKLFKAGKISEAAAVTLDNIHKGQNATFKNPNTTLDPAFMAESRAAFATQTGQQAQARTTTTTAPTQQRTSQVAMPSNNSPPITVQFLGQNIVDESSKNRFVRQTVTGIRSLGSRVVKAG